MLNESQNNKIGNLKFDVIHVPGHTSGHIAFHFKKEKVVFTGDTLFSLGCGRVFEGTNEQMFNSLNKLKNLPYETKIYCGHEYTKKNLDFCIKFDTRNSALKDKLKIIEEKTKKNVPTIPTTIADEIKTNIFLRCNNQELKKDLNMANSSDEDIFNKLRGLKDNF